MSLLDKLTKKAIVYDELSENVILDALRKHDNIPQLTRTPIGADAYIHSSSLDNFCARRAAIFDKNNSTPREYVQGAMKIVWKMGRAVEEHIREALISSLGKKNFHGQWECKCGKTKHIGLWADKDCQVCGTKTNNYKELTIYNEEYKIANNPDLVAVSKNNQKIIIEIKSMNKEDFDELEAPLSSHVRQANRYVRFSRMNGSVTSGKVTIVYARKDYKYSGVYKPFVVDVDTVALETAFLEELDQAKKLREYFKTSELPEREFCVSAMSPMAKKCLACNDCFK
jgi:hypothetical protein